tara:strand:+ start:1143 stop:1553 length:411 start_codon:yes stop_codon:yes gene_type:complete
LKGDYQPTRAIQMSAQTAELNIIGFDFKEELNISCSLRNIARGNCNLSIKPLTSSSLLTFGSLHISIDRPMMNGEIFLKEKNFIKLANFFKVSFPRPVTIVILLEEDLFINTPGDLKLEQEKNLKITNVSWNLPLA